MKTKIILTILVALAGTCPVKATTWWDGGYHVINDADIYGELFLENDASVDMFGGTVGKLETFDISTANIYGGDMGWLWCNDDTIVNIYGGTFNWLAASDGSSIYLYAYDLTYYPTGGLYDNPWLEGRYYTDDNLFSFTFYHGEEDFQHITVVPEPPNIPAINIQRAIAEKGEVLAVIDKMLDKEREVYGALEELLESGDYGDLKRGNIVKAKQKIQSAIQHEEQSKKALVNSIKKLKDALATLGWQPVAYDR